jgi:hypothetical protein
MPMTKETLLKNLKKVIAELEADEPGEGDEDELAALEKEIALCEKRKQLAELKGGSNNPKEKTKGKAQEGEGEPPPAARKNRWI